METIDDKVAGADKANEKDDGSDNCSENLIWAYGECILRGALFVAFAAPITAVPILKGAADYRSGMPMRQKLPDSALDMGLTAAVYSALFLGSGFLCSRKPKESKEYKAFKESMERSRLEYIRTHPMSEIRTKEELDYYLVVTHADNANDSSKEQKKSSLKDRLVGYCYTTAAAAAIGTVITGPIFAYESAFYTFGYLAAAAFETSGL